MASQTIPCADCAAAQARFEAQGFRVGDCQPDPLRPQSCRIDFEAPALPGPADAPTSPLTPTQARTAQAIVNLFETGQVLGDYGQVTVLSGDPGRLSYGRSQTTIGSGNLQKLLQRYARNPGARFGHRLERWRGTLDQSAASLDHDQQLHNLLRACADDPVMRETQDAFFDEHYWQPAVRAALGLGLRSPLATAVVYDGHVHGSWKLLRDQTTQAAGQPQLIGERAWIGAYVERRRQWLAQHRLSILHGTVYRMDAFKRLIALGQWGLGLPLVVRQAEISLVTLNATPPGCYDGPQAGTRPLALQQPLARGLDVRLLQLALSDLGADIKADGVFGQGSQRCVRELQIARALPVTGMADIALIALLVGVGPGA